MEKTTISKINFINLNSLLSKQVALVLTLTVFISFLSACSDGDSSTNIDYAVDSTSIETTSSEVSTENNDEKSEEAENKEEVEDNSDPIEITLSEFEDNAEKYIGKKVTIAGTGFLPSIQEGGLDYTDRMTLRSKGDSFEDDYTSLFFSSENQSETGNKYYYRVVNLGPGSGTMVKIRIPKAASSSMPNMELGDVDITGIVKNATLIEIISIKRTWG